MSAMEVNTNNHLERWNGTLKYVFMLKKKARTLATLLTVLVAEVMPHYIHDRQKKLAGLESSGTLLITLTVCCQLVRTLMLQRSFEQNISKVTLSSLI